MGPQDGLQHQILAINPGSTTTKIAVYRNEALLWSQAVEHRETLTSHTSVEEQLTMRREAVLEVLESREQQVASLSAIVGRGGMLPPVKAGGYLVNKAMKERLKASPTGFHASNLGALLADSIGGPLGIPAYIYDAVSADELWDVARITGLPEVTRQSFCHVLNAKATCRKVAASMGGRYEAMGFLVAHLGGGISISAHQEGRMVDVISDDGGPFSPQRSGSVPLRAVVDMCYSGRYGKEDMLAKLRGMGGIRAHLGTHDCRLVEERIAAGDVYARQVYQAQAYQIAKGIGELAPVLEGRIDAVILTGGLAYSQILTQWVSRRVSFLGPVVVVPGEHELEALALGALRILRGEEAAHEYTE